MRYFNGLGTGSNKDAVEQATKGMVNPTGIIYFADCDQMEEVDRLIHEKYSDTNIMGVAGSVFFHGKVIDFGNQLGTNNNNGICVIGFYEDSEIRMGLIEDVKNIPILSLRNADKNLSEINGNKDDTICITFNVIEEETVVSTLKPILNKYNIKMIGASVGGFYGKAVEPFIMLNGKKYKETSGYIFIKNKVGKVKVYRQDIYEQIDEDLLTITKVKDLRSRCLEEVNGVKIDKLYCEKYGISVNDMKNNIIMHTLTAPIAAIVGNEHYIISMDSLNSNGSVNTFKKVNEGESIAYMKAAEFDRKENDLVERIKREMPNRSFIFSIDCLYRAVYYNNNKYIDSYAKGMNSIADHIGIIGVGEQNEIQHFNQTMICVVFE